MTNFFSGFGNIFGGKRNGCGGGCGGCDGCGGCGINTLWILILLYVVFCTDILNCIDPCWLILLLMLLLSCTCKDEREERHCGC